MPAPSKYNSPQSGFTCPYSSTARKTIEDTYNALTSWLEVNHPQRLPAHQHALGGWRLHHLATYFAPIDKPDSVDLAQLDIQAKASYLGNFLRGYTTFKTDVMLLALSSPLVQISYLNGVACKGYNIPATILQRLDRVQDLATQRANDIFNLTPNH